MNPIFAAALEVQAVCHAHGWRFCFIGGLAVQRWGEPRFTQDVDITIITGFGGEAATVDELLQHFKGRLNDAREFALRHRVLLLQATSGIPIDVALGAMPFEERAAARASKFPIASDSALLTCSAEDLVVFKAFAGRERDWLDIEGIVLRQGPHLDEGLIVQELEPLLRLRDDRDTARRLRSVLTGTRTERT